ncbi:MAG TPA: Xaa-Pro peptidase family protein [Anaerolineae bacterium]|nr:Xaa-Pro peptidase family protein [Anaerolineae bacterium]
MRLFDYAKASALMDESGIDLVLVSSPENVGYLADYSLYINSGHPFILDGTEQWTGRMVGLPKEEKREAFIAAISFEETLLDHYGVWIRDRRYFGPRMVYQGRAEKHAEHTDLVNCVAEAICERGLSEGTIAVDMAFMSAQYYMRLRELLPKASFVDAESLLWRLRIIKSPEEIRRIRKAAQATDAAVDAAYAACYEGMPELEFQRILKQTMVQEGTDYGWSSVAFGPKGALLVLATEERLKPGEIVRTDACARYQGYISDISRVRVFGQPSDEARRAHDAIYTANRMLAEAARPGVRCCDLYQIVMAHLKKRGYESLSPQTGHGLGRDAHEPPMLAGWNEMILEPNMIVVFEPTMRVVGVGSVNVEDMVLITESGNEALTTSVRELVCCGVPAH